MIEKKCKVCQELLPLSAFARHPNCKYGVTSTCKNCFNAWHKEYFRTNPDKKEKKRQTDKRYHREHIEEHNARNRRYRQENPEQSRQAGIEYRLKNLDKLKEYFKNYYQKNRRKKIADASKYYQQNKSTRDNYLKKYRQENRDKLREKTRELKRANKERYKIYGLNYLARKNNADGFYTIEQWMTLCDSFNSICPGCNKQVESFQVDHIVPLTWEGTSNWITNVQPLCKPCNTGKGNHRATDYRHKYVKAWAKEQLYWQKVSMTL